MRLFRQATASRYLSLAWSLAISFAIFQGAVFGQQGSIRYTPPKDISVDGHRIDSLFLTVTWLIAALFIAITAILAYSMIVFRAKPGGRAHYDRGDTKKDAAKSLTVALIIFLGVDGPLLGYSHADINNIFWNFPENLKDYKPGQPGKADEEVLRVEVLAQQWAWNFRYAGKDGKFNTEDDVVTLNDFRVPAGKKVLLQITSKDVIHSLFLVNCRIKRDANPGEITRMWFQTKDDTAGDYQVTCAQMCGYAHYMMQGSFRVMNEKDFSDWYDEASRISKDWSTAQGSYEKDHPELKLRNNYAWGWEWKSEQH